MHLIFGWGSSPDAAKQSKCQNAQMPKCQNVKMIQHLSADPSSQVGVLELQTLQNDLFFTFLTKSTHLKSKMCKHAHQKRKIAITRRSWHLQSSTFARRNSNYMPEKILIVPRLQKKQKHFFEEIFVDIFYIFGILGNVLGVGREGSDMTRRDAPSSRIVMSGT